MQSNLPVLPVAVLESLYEHLPPYSSDMAENFVIFARQIT
jgi:hypothetical protein